MDILSQAVVNIIKAQESIVGPVALEQAKRVQAIKLGKSLEEISIEGNKKEALEQLVKQYQGLFGMASIEVCKNAIRGMKGSIPNDQLPPLLAQ